VSMERGTKALIVVIAVLAIVMVASTFIPQTSGIQQATGIFPQVVSCVQEDPTAPTSDPNWKPTLIVQVEPNRDPGRIREYRVLGCTLYYYHAHFK